MRTSVLCLSALLLAACTKDAPEAVVIDENAAIDTITQQALYDHIAYLADDAREGRMAGERGYDEAAQYVADRFAEMGLTPGGDDGWYQHGDEGWNKVEVTDERAAQIDQARSQASSSGAHAGDGDARARFGPGERARLPQRQWNRDRATCPDLRLIDRKTGVGVDHLVPLAVVRDREHGVGDERLAPAGTDHGVRIGLDLAGPGEVGRGRLAQRRNARRGSVARVAVGDRLDGGIVGGVPVVALAHFVDRGKLRVEHDLEQVQRPVVLALGTIMSLWGLVSSWLLSGVGLLLFAIALGGWIGDIRHEEH